MSLSPRLVALQGFGSTPRLVSVQGLWPAADAAVGGGAFVRRPGRQRADLRDDDEETFMAATAAAAWRYRGTVQ